MIDIAATFANYLGGPFPDYTGKNATGAGATDGTEWIRAYIDNFGFGWTQALLNYMGLTPDGNTEADGSSQIVDAIGMYMPVGCIVEWNRVNDPATDGLRYLLLNGQGILVANYPDLVVAVYVGDANNAAVAAAGGAYYRADDAAGTTPNTAGAYLILPESRGYTTRGLDSAASVDPDGASRYLGDNQLDAFQGHEHFSGVTYTGTSISPYGDDTTEAPGSTTYRAATASGAGTQQAITSTPKTDGVNGTPRTDEETRMVNRSTQFAIRY